MKIKILDASRPVDENTTPKIKMCSCSIGEKCPLEEKIGMAYRCTEEQLIRHLWANPEDKVTEEKLRNVK